MRALFKALALMAAVCAPAAHADVLERFFSDVKSYQAKFEQTVTDAEDRTIQRSSGELWIARPGKFRWDYAAPYEQKIIGDGAKIWVYDVGLEQVSVRPVSQALGDTPAALLAGKGRLQDRFGVRSLKRDGSPLAWYELRPKNKDGGYEYIRLGFAGKRLDTVELVDGFAQTTRIVLRDYRENPRIDPQQFRFVPPPGVDVISP